MKIVLICFGLLLFGSITKAQEKQYTVLFDYDKFEIPDSAMLKIMKIIGSSTIRNITIEGHCDSVGSKQYNYGLSEKRANAVKRLLIQNGIDKKDIKTCVGYGKDKPVMQKGKYSETYLNRRVILYFNPDEKIPNEPASVKLSSMNKIEFKAGTLITLDKLFFYGARHVLMDESYPTLQKLCDIMKTNPNLKIEIQGHVCCTTTEPDGNDIDLGTANLSVTRAKMVYDYLITKCGISSKRLSYKGYGGTRKLVAHETSEAEMRLNRRVEILVLEN